MALQTRLASFITAIGADIKQLRIWETGSASGDLTGLTTTAKTSLLAAINELDAETPYVGTSAPANTSRLWIDTN